MATATSIRPRVPLLGPRGLPYAVVLMGVAFLAFVAMAVWLSGDADGAAFDLPLDTWLLDHTGTTTAEVLLAVSEPGLTMGIVGVVVVGTALARRWDLAIFALVGPPLAVLVGSEILKPIIDRQYGLAEQLSGGAVQAGYAFPSGHETALTGVVVMLCVLLLRTTCGRRAKTIGVVVGALWVVVGAIGLVRNHYHYATDTLGGMCVGTVVVLATALVVDAAWPRINSRLARSPSRTPPAT